MVKKMQENGPGYWVIHKDHLTEMQAEKVTSQGTISPPSHDTSQRNISDTSHMVTIPAEVYIQQQKEHDNILQGMMMNRWKFEDLERQIRLLPAPAEVVTAQLMETEEALKAEVDYRDQLRVTLQEKEVRIQEQEQKFMELQAELERARLPWWKKLFGK